MNYCNKFKFEIKKKSLDLSFINWVYFESFYKTGMEMEIMFETEIMRNRTVFPKYELNVVIFLKMSKIVILEFF